jgi:hypothetical protein
MLPSSPLATRMLVPCSDAFMASRSNCATSDHVELSVAMAVSDTP